MRTTIERAWGWVGADPREIIAVNKFGNVIFTDNQERVWRLSPEDLECKVIAQDNSAYTQLRIQESFTTDWGMSPLVAEAEARYGIQPPGRCFCLKIPSPLGGSYSISNIATITNAELISASGDMARQIKDLPDGSRVRLEVSE